MNIEVTRKIFGPKSTIGEMLIDGVHECFVLEDRDRGLTQDMTREDILAIKVKDETAIPVGTYEVTVDLSDRFKRLMPHILNVPGFDGIRIHPGNTDVDTAGCLLPGRIYLDEDDVADSLLAFNQFFPKLRSAVDHGKVFITVKRADGAQLPQ